MKMPEFIKRADPDRRYLLFSHCWDLLTEESEVDGHGEWTNIIEPLHRTCKLCGRVSMHVTTSSQWHVECSNPECLYIRELLGLTKGVDKLWPEAYKPGSRERDNSVKAIREVGKEYGADRSLRVVPMQFRLEVAKQAAALFLIYQSKGVINGKARIQRQENRRPEKHQRATRALESNNVGGSQ